MFPLNLRIVFSVSGMRNYFIWVSKNSPCKAAVAKVTIIYHNVAHSHSCRVFNCKLQREVFSHADIVKFYIWNDFAYHQQSIISSFSRRLCLKGHSF